MNKASQRNGGNNNMKQHRVVTAAELCARPDPEREAELLGPLVVRGYRTMIAGGTGEGKTVLSLQMLAALTEGRPFLNWQGKGDCRALVIELEQGERTLKRRLRERGLDRSTAVEFLCVPEGLALDHNEDDREMIDAVLAEGGYDVVVIDPLYKLHTGDSNDERAATDLLKVLDEWRDTYGFALVLVAHTRKALSGNRYPPTIHDVFGSSAYTRAPEIVLGISRQGNGRGRLHIMKDRDGDLDIGSKLPLLFTPDEGYQIDPHPGKPNTLDLVRDLLHEHPEGLTKKQLEEKTDKSQTTIENALNKLGIEGKPLPGSRANVYMLAEHQHADDTDLAQAA